MLIKLFKKQLKIFKKEKCDNDTIKAWRGETEVCYCKIIILYVTVYSIM